MSFSEFANGVPFPISTLQKVQNGEDFPIGRVNNPGGHLEWVLVTPK